MEWSFARTVKTRLNTVARITCLMKLAELQNPPHMVRVPEYPIPKRYFTQDYFVALDENGVNKRLDLTLMELLNPPAGKDLCVPPEGERTWPIASGALPCDLGGMHVGLGKTGQSRYANWRIERWNEACCVDAPGG